MTTKGADLDPNQYDPCFLLPLFLQYLSSDDAEEELHPSRVDIRGFYIRNCLAFAVGALSSYSRNIRGLAKSVIARFRLLSEAWEPTKIPSTPTALAAMKQFPERVQLNFMLDTLRNSLSTKAAELGGGARSAALFGSRADTSFRLSRVHANFFIHALGMLTKPEHRMYEVFWNTFMAKPAIDLGTVPDFMRIMYSVHKDFRVERQWMVKLCADSLNDTSDYLLLEKSRVYKYCLLLYADPGVDTTTQIQILRLLTATTRIPRACHALTRFHAFPLWLFRHALSTTHAPSLCYFFTIISQMLAAFEEAKEDSPCLSMLRLLIRPSVGTVTSRRRGRTKQCFILASSKAFEVDPAAWTAKQVLSPVDQMGVSGAASPTVYNFVHHLLDVAIKFTNLMDDRNPSTMSRMQKWSGTMLNTTMECIYWVTSV
ncbi:Nucleolar pre-ribosomal-associated protein 1 [Taenia crassiceps]|uniref:Nucleolar pre-ribosomal-associated protein 1 n=1 Tax=Taenia crassiceps TaxID=6207 RepID=A0ABR4Q4W3_9CEST